MTSSLIYLYIGVFFCMKILWFDVNISKSGVNITKDKQDNTADLFSNTDLSSYYVWSSVWDLWAIKTDKKDAFYILRKNVIVSAAWKLMSNRVWANGIWLIDDKWEIVDLESDRVWKEIVERANKFFAIPSLYNYVYRSFGMILWAWQKFSTIDQMNWIWEATEESKIKILDSRYVSVKSDAYWTPVSYSYNWLEQLSPEIVVDYIVYEDLDNPIYGMSQIESILIDALTDYATSTRQLLFFKNNAMPNVVYMLDKSKIKNEEQAKEFERIITEKHWWNSQSNKPLASTFIDDIKILEMSHKDLDLINQRIFSHKEAWVVLWFDLRLLSYMKDSWWSFSEMDSLTLKNANSQLEVYAKRIEVWMKLEYEKFIWPIPYSFKLQNELYKDIKAETDLVTLQINSWMITPNQANKIIWLPVSDDVRLDEYYLSNSLSIMWTNETTEEPVRVESSE